jgi:hypothetical protein
VTFRRWAPDGTELAPITYNRGTKVKAIGPDCPLTVKVRVIGTTLIATIGHQDIA